LTHPSGDARFIQSFQTSDCERGGRSLEPSRVEERLIGEGSARTRDRLLDAAESLFAARGFRATSVRNITAEAACNVAAVNYHFGGKVNLYREMFHRRLVALRDQRVSSIRRAMAKAGSRAGLETLLRAFTMAFLEPHLDQSGGRRLMQLFSRELLDPHLRPGTLRREMVEPVQRELGGAMRSLCPGLDERSARRCSHSLIAQLVHVVQLRRAPGVAREAIQAELSFPAAVSHIVQFSAAGIRSYRR